MSPTTFRSPATYAATNGDSLATHCRKAKNLSRRLASFVPTTLLPCYHWRGQRVYSGGFWCQQFLPIRAMPEYVLPISRSFIFKYPLGLSEWPVWPAISLAIPSANFLVTVHIFLVANRIQQPLQIHIPSLEVQGFPWPIPFMSLVHTQLPSTVFSSIGMPALLLGNISTKIFEVSPAGFC